MVLKLFKGDVEIKPGDTINSTLGFSRIFFDVKDADEIIIKYPSGGTSEHSVHGYPGYEIRHVMRFSDWKIDETAGRPILTYKGCSVIEAEDAKFVLSAVENALSETLTVGQIIDALAESNPGYKFDVRVIRQELSKHLATSQKTETKFHTIADAAHDRFPNSATACDGFIAGAQWAFKQGR